MISQIIPLTKTVIDIYELSLINYIYIICISHMIIMKHLYQQLPSFNKGGQPTKMNPQRRARSRFFSASESWAELKP